MNIDITFGAEINRVSVGVKGKDGIVKRTCKLVLAREFDTLLTAGLKGDSLRVLRSLEQGGLTEATLPIDAILASGTIKPLGVASGEAVRIPELRGLRAKAKAAKNPDDPPSIRLEFEFEWNEVAWVFLGRNCSAQAEVTIKSLQTEMDFPVGTHAKGKNGRRPRAET